MFNRRFQGVIALSVFGSLFMAAIGTCYAMKTGPYARDYFLKDGELLDTSGSGLSP